MRTRLKNIRIFLFSLTLFLMIFVPPISIKTYKIEWFIIFSIFIIIDFLVIISKRKKIKIDKIGISIFIFIVYNIVLFILSISNINTQINIGFFHFGRVSVILIYYFWLNNIFSGFDYNILKKYIRFILMAFFIFFVTDFYFLNKFVYWYGYEGYRLQFLNFDNPNYLAYFTVTSFVFMKNLIKSKLVKTLIFLITSNIILLTRSKAGLLAILIILLINFFKINISNGIKKKVLQLFVILVILISSIFLYDYILNLDILKRINLFFVSIFKGQFSEINRLKVQLYFLEDNNWNPFFGYYYYKFFSENLYTMHSMFAEILYDIGIFGLGLFLGFLYFIYKALNKSRYGIELLVIMIFFSLTENYLFYFLPLIYLFILVISTKKNLT